MHQRACAACLGGGSSGSGSGSSSNSARHCTAPHAHAVGAPGVFRGCTRYAQLSMGWDCSPGGAGCVQEQESMLHAVLLCVGPGGAQSEAGDLRTIHP